MIENDINSNAFGNIKILMLKGEKGDQGEGVYDDTDIRNQLTEERRQRVSGDSVVQMQMDTFINANGGNRGETVLWSGAAYYRDQQISLSESPDSFDWIEIHFGNVGNKEIRKVSVSDFISSNGVALTLPVTIDTISAGDTYGFRITKINLVAIDNSHTTYKVEDARRISWDGISDSDSVTDVVATSGVSPHGGVITEIVGVKLMADAEVADIRVGVDGTVYVSAGAAVRAQIHALQESGGGSLEPTGVIAGSYGPAANDQTIKIPYITVDANGRLTYAINNGYFPRYGAKNTTIAAGNTSGSVAFLHANSYYPLLSVQCYEIADRTKDITYNPLSPDEFTYYISESSYNSGGTVYVRLSEAHTWPVLVVVQGQIYTQGM